MVGRKYSAQYKIQTVQEYLKASEETGISIAHFAADKGISDSTFNDWVIKYRRQGTGFCNITNELAKLNEVEIVEPVVRLAQATREDYSDPSKVRLEYNGAAIIFHESLLERVMGILQQW